MRTVPLQQLCDIQIGKTPSRSVAEYWGGELPWATISDFAAGRIVTTTKEKITRIGAAKSRSKRIPRGTLLLSFKLSLGKRTISGCDLFTNEAIAALHILNHDVADRDYLYWALGSIDYDRLVDRAAKGKTLNKAKLKLLRIPLPPLAEQRRIAQILDAADALRAKRRQALTQLDALIQSTFLDMFGDPVTNSMGWEMANGGRVSRRLTVGIVVRPASYYQPTGVPAIRSLNVRTNKIEIASLVHVSAENNEGRLKMTRVWKDDVLLVRSGQPGTAAVVPAELDGVNAIDILILTPDQHVAHPVYLSSYFNSAGGKRMVLGAQRGQIQKHLNVGSLRSAPIPLPPLDLQCRFAAIVESVEQQRALRHAHLAELDTLFASLQSRAFHGDL